MKVFEVTTSAKPEKSNYKEFASVIFERAEIPLVGYFHGEPRLPEWKIRQTHYINPKKPKANFTGLGLGAFVIDEKAMREAGEPLEMSGEYLEIEVEGEAAPYWIYNCTNIANVLDQKRSKWVRVGKGPNDRYLDKPLFLPDRFGEESLFKISENNGSRIFCLERSGDPEDGEFKATVETCRLTGLSFRLVWTND